jgi:hypothetical protein
VCAEESEKEAVLQVPAPFGYERAVSVDHASMLLGELRPYETAVAPAETLVETGVPVERALRCASERALHEEEVVA